MVMARDDGSDGKERRAGKREHNTLLNCTVLRVVLHCPVLYGALLFGLVHVDDSNFVYGGSPSVHWHSVDLKDECMIHMTPSRGPRVHFQSLGRNKFMLPKGFW